MSKSKSMVVEPKGEIQDLEKIVERRDLLHKLTTLKEDKQIMFEDWA